jgi:hypothetical protein
MNNRSIQALHENYTNRLNKRCHSLSCYKIHQSRKWIRRVFGRTLYFHFRDPQNKNGDILIITNTMHCLSSVYWVFIPLHVSDVSAALHQEVECIYVENGTCYTSELTVSRSGQACCSDIHIYTHSKKKIFSNVKTLLVSSSDCYLNKISLTVVPVRQVPLFNRTCLQMIMCM